MRRTLGLAAATSPVIVLAILGIAVAPHGPLAAALMALLITAVGAVGALVRVTGGGDPPADRVAARSDVEEGDGHR